MNSPKLKRHQSICISPFQLYLTKKTLESDDPLLRPPLIKIKSEGEHISYHDHSGPELVDGKSIYQESIDKLYEEFFNSLARKDFLLPH